MSFSNAARPPMSSRFKSTGADGVPQGVLSKSESVADFDALKQLDVIALCETARGVLAATSLAALDCVVALMRGAEDLVAWLGFTATARIHPSQVAVVRESYAPTVEQIASARALLAAAKSQPGVFTFEGRMVDGPILRHAECVVARAELREG